MKETEDSINRRKDILCPYIVRICIVKMTILPKAIYRIKEILSKYQGHFSQNWNKNKMFNSMETQKILNRQNNLEKEEWSWRDQTP